MNRYGKRCVLYPRVSTEMQVDGYSLEGQKTMLTRFADREEMVIVDTYEDAGKSGKSIEGRPAFQKMLRDIEEGLDIDYVLVYKLSRFGRNAADILNSLELIQSYGVNLICIEEGIDSSQTSGKLLISVLSAVAEIERENIIEQTMNGRREKARQGGWNGGFAPYGYALVDNKLVIAEAEAVAIRRIFELYTSSEIGLGGVANQLNLEGIRKIPRQNGTLEDWTGHFIKLILDNPVYYGKIAYGRRTKEKVKGTKNDYQMKRNDDYILTDGQHEGIVSEEVWEKAHAKRLRTGVKQPSKIGRDRVHLLSGLLKCPVCGSPMYTNKHAWTNKDGTYKEVYYYVCSRNRMVRGKHCEYKAMLKKTDIEPMVIEAIREIVRNKEYAQAIKKRIGVQIDTKAVDKELEGYRAKLKEVDLNKSRLEREIDNLPIDTKYRERKLHDMTLRLDSLYDIIVELEEKIEDAMMRRDAIAQQAITLEGIYKIMVNFDCVYNIISDEEKRAVVTALIKEIELYRNDESECPLKRIGLNFPVFKDGKEVSELLWDKGNTVETNTYYEGDRYTTAQHRETLKINGWTFCPVDIMDEDGVAALPVKNGKWFTEMHVGSHQLNYDSMLVLTHFKGHTMGGFGGSNKNIGIGCADGRIGKAEIHTAVGSDNMWSISEEELMERISESAKATVDYFKDHISFINVMRNMSVSCDCEGVSAAPVVTPNVGILASLDICAIDQASVDLIYAMKEEDHHDLVERIKTRHGLRQLSYMQELGMGNRKYKLIDLDNNQSPLTLQEAVAHVVPFVEPKKVAL